jgi:hypothetical protein
VTPLDPSLLDSAKGARDRLVDARHAADEARADYQYAIRKLHAGGGSMREIAEELGLSHQRVHQIVDEDGPDKPGITINLPWSRGRERKGSGGPFRRFTPRARAAVVHAQDEAVRLDHQYIGTEHLLLGLLRVEDGLAARVLGKLDVTLEASRAAVVEIIGRGTGVDVGCHRKGPGIPFTPRAKKVLELSLREAKVLDHDYIGTEHLLLGLAREGEGVAIQVLATQGTDAQAVRAEVERMLAA